MTQKDRAQAIVDFVIRCVERTAEIKGPAGNRTLSFRGAHLVIQSAQVTEVRDYMIDEVAKYLDFRQTLVPERPPSPAPVKKRRMIISGDITVRPLKGLVDG